MRARHCEDGREETLRRAWGMLLALGAAPTYAGFRQAAAAACAAAGRPELLRQAGFAGERRPTCGEFVGLLAARLAGAERA